MSWIDPEGNYHKGRANASKLRSNRQSGWKQWDHQRQRKDYAREVIQPFERDGKPNPKFREAWPNEAKTYFKENQ
jgi:hypothetical protein